MHESFLNFHQIVALPVFL